MKKITTLFVIAISFAISLPAQFNWQEQMISPGNNLKEMNFYDTSVFLVGYGRTFVKSTDMGETWNDVPILTPVYDFYDLSIDATGVGYLCSGDEKIFNNPSGGEPDVYIRGVLLKTADYGATWQHVDISAIGSGDDPAFNPNADGCYAMHIYSVGVVDDNIAFIGLQWYWHDPSTSGRVTYNGIFRTDDGGTTWVPFSKDNKVPYTIEAADTSVYFGGNKQLLKTVIGTDTIVDIYPNLVAAADPSVFIWDVTIVSEDEIYVTTTSDGILLSTDRGETFNKLTGTGVPGGGNDMIKLNDSTMVVLGTSTKSKVTTDYGANWKNCYPGATCYEIGGVLNDSLYGLAKGKVYKIAVEDLLAADYNWVSQTLNEGSNLQKMHISNNTTPNAVIAGFGETLKGTSDGGVTWYDIELPKLDVAEYPEYDWSDISTSNIDGTSYACTRRLYFIDYPSSSGLIDVYGHGLIAKSNDSWETWDFLDYRNIGAGETDPSLNPNLADACYGLSPTELESINDSTLYVYITWLDTLNGYDNKTTHSRVFMTENGGDTWSVVTDDLGNRYVTKIMFLNADTGYIAGNTLLLNTTDGGKTFTDIYPPLAQASIDVQDDSTLYITAMDYINEKEWYFTTSVDGVFETHDGGETYSMFTGIGGGNDFYKVDTSSYVVLGSSTKSKVTWDKGATWTSCYPGSTVWNIGGVLNGSLVALAKGKLFKIPLWNLEPPGTDILSFVLEEQNSDAVINSTDHTIAIDVVPGTDPSSLKPQITISNGATITPDTSQAQDFTDPVIYTVTGFDGSTQDWTVTVTVLVSVSDLEEGGVNLYPNPVKNTLFINNAGNIDRIRISSLTGTTLLEIATDMASEMKIDLGNLSRGIYIISFHDRKGKVYTTKLVKE